MTPATAVRERPILFSGPMVRAILDGRKTVTRRVVKRLGGNPWFDEDDGVWRDHWEVWAHGASEGPTYDETPELRCPYGAPGDQLWVRETFRPYRFPGKGLVRIQYEADGTVADLPPARPYLFPDDDEDLGADRNPPRWIRCKRRPSIFMPRWACRLVLEVVSVRVERLQEITCVGIRREGLDCPTHDFAGGFCSSECPDLRRAFAKLWDSLNAARGFGWDANPFVWCVEFRRCP